ncbi:MAG: hypothetical protein GX928_02275 [Ruminococcaceae bacterium]|nr:hypothetical protein [Oscillospiraceae bacterium]
MNELSQIKSAVSVESLLLRYGFNLNHNKMCCPFHKEKTPSFHVKGEHWKCFGCGKGGDIFDFTSEYFGISLSEAMKKVDDDFNLNLIKQRRTKKEKRIAAAMRKAREFEKRKHDEELEAYRDNYNEKCNTYRNCQFYLANNQPRLGEFPDDKYIECVTTIQYLDYWFENNPAR